MVGNKHQVNFQYLFALQDKPGHYILHLVQCHSAEIWFQLLYRPATEGTSSKIYCMRHIGISKLNTYHLRV